MTTELQNLIDAALDLADPTGYAHRGRIWHSEGGRSCPIGWDGCSQTVFVDSRTGEYDYGERGGPGHQSCKETCPHDMNPPPPDEELLPVDEESVT